MRIFARWWLGARSALVLIAVALSAGCSWRSDPLHFYVLSGVSPATTTSSATSTTTSTESGSGLTIGVGPITLPRYLERINIVTRRDSELEVSEYDRWGELLSAGVPRVMAKDLSALLGTERIVMFPWPIGSPIDRQVVADIVRFDGTAGGDVVLEARWQILGPDRQEVARRYSIQREPTGAPGYPALVAAMNRSLETFSREIADAIKQLPVPDVQRKS